MPTPTAKEIPGFVGYAADVDGSIYSRRRGEWRRMRASALRDGYPGLTLKREVGTKVVAVTKKQTVRVSHLVLLAFAGPRPDGADACHEPDPDVTNNAASNLRWGTRQENIDEKVRNGRHARGETHGRARLTAAEVGQIRDLYRSDALTAPQIARDYGITARYVYELAYGRSWTTQSRRKHRKP